MRTMKDTMGNRGRQNNGQFQKLTEGDFSKTTEQAKWEFAQIITSEKEEE